MFYLFNFYHKEVIPNLMKLLKYDNRMQVPNIEKITLNMGLGSSISQKNYLEYAKNDLMLITGQKPLITKAKRSIANFKIRRGDKIGIKVTLRKKMMWNFLDKLILIAIPRIKDFRGLSPDSFDGKGNYNLGIKEQIIFPEIIYDKIDKIRGFDISINTTSKNDKEGFLLLSQLNFPFKQGGNSLWPKNP